MSRSSSAGKYWGPAGANNLPPQILKSRPRSVFDRAPIDYSPETRKVINELMAEARLTMAQRDKALFPLLREYPGRATSANSNNARSAAGLKRASSTGSLASRDGSCCSGSKTPIISRTARRGGKRPKSVILATGAWERPQFDASKGKPGRDPEKEVSRLQSMMAYGEDIDELDDLCSNDGTSRRTPPLKHYNKPEGLSRYAEILEEIDEREEFLERMKNLGLGEKYKGIIDAQISSKKHEIWELEHEAQRKLDMAKIMVADRV